MDFEDTQEAGPTEQQFPPAESWPGGAQTPPETTSTEQPKRRPWRIFLWIMLVLSILANFFLFIMLIAVGVAFATGQRGFFTESIVRKGTLGNKIVVIRLEGIINGRLSEQVRKQIKTASRDKNVKALIVRTISPGGTVSASDQIHHEITKFREETGKPVIAFMQSVAASGGYYTSVACDKIVAEPTVITGSIGVMLSHLVVKELFENKLGISTAVVKSGPRKDWPSIFEEVTDEQRQYLMDKLVGPAYERFVRLVNDGRSTLNESEVREMADGSIYGAPEALDKQLIDEVGYINEAIAAAESLAGIEDAHVIEYERPFSLTTFFSAQSKSVWKIDKDSLREITVPQLLYLWDASW